MEVIGNIRINSMKARQNIRQHILPRHAAGGYLEQSLDFALVLFQVEKRVFPLVKNFDGGNVELLARRGKLRLFIVALEQGDVQFLFQLGNMVAQGGLR
ncbi:hypothetical protein SDC9_93386 [bioreactor metagenome]|uniref:Uncharacterized protein n=1 Tax=bioreactor metagenome TaxID=1076179 RepID=A0A645A349_9ZZZZ